MIPFQIPLYSGRPFWETGTELSDVDPTGPIYEYAAGTSVVSHIWEEYPQSAAFLYYAGFGLFDPKMPGEYRAFGKGYVAANIIAVGALLWWLDPDDKRTGGLMQTPWWQRNVRENQWQIGGTTMPWE